MTQLVVMPAEGFAALCLAASGSDMEAAQSLIDAIGIALPDDEPVISVPPGPRVQKEAK